MKGLKIVAALSIVGIVIWYGNVSHKETVAQRAIVNEVRGLVDACRNSGDAVTIAGKVLVWDMRADSRSGAHGMLPGTLKAASIDRPITVFMVMGQRDEKVGTYSISGQPAYRQYMDVAVAYWPEKKPVGFHSVVSREPRSSRPVQQTPEYGDPNEPIARWIASLPTINK
jgi:hypothetical protein